MGPYCWECHLTLPLEIPDFFSSVCHIFRSKGSELCELRNFHIHIEFNHRRGILPIPLGLNNLRSKEKAKGTNLYEVILLKRKQTNTIYYCLVFQI